MGKGRALQMNVRAINAVKKFLLLLKELACGMVAEYSLLFCNMFKGSYTTMCQSEWKAK
jgi:hypothetical protein